MIEKCANPTCSRPFHYLRGGRLYCFELRPGVAFASRQSAKRITVYFWICERCSASLSLEFDAERGILLKEAWETSPRRTLHCSACSEAQGNVA